MPDTAERSKQASIKAADYRMKAADATTTARQFNSVGPINERVRRYYMSIAAIYGKVADELQEIADTTEQ